METWKRQRINALYRKEKEVGLSEDEKREQAKLRTEYVNSFRARVKKQLDQTVVMDEEGRKRPLKRKKKSDS